MQVRLDTRSSGYSLSNHQYQLAYMMRLGLHGPLSLFAFAGRSVALLLHTWWDGFSKEVRFLEL